MLGSVGLSEVEEQIYLALLRRSASLTEILRMVELSPAESRRALRTLEAKGLVSRSLGGNRHYVAASPLASLEILALKKQEELQKVRLVAQQLEHDFKNEARQRGADLVEVIVGKDAVLERYEQVLLGAHEELRYFDVPPYAGTTTTPEEEAARRVRCRCIYDTRALEWPGKLDEIEQLLASGEEGRLLRNLPMPLVIADRSTALLPLSLEDPDMGARDLLIVHAGPLLESLIILFEVLWEQAAPLTLAKGVVGVSDHVGVHVLSTEDARLLALVGVDAKDEVISRQLGMSRRSVQRRVRRLMSDFGVQTRLQLAVEAVRRGQI